MSRALNVACRSPTFFGSVLRKNRSRWPQWFACDSVTTWSPLAAAFNSKPDSRWNLKLLGKPNVGLFGYEELQDFTGFYLMRENAEFEAEELVEEAINPARGRKLVQVFDQLSDCLCRVADMADFIRIAHVDHHFRQAAEESCVQLGGLVERLNTNTEIHQALQRVLQKGDKFPEDSVDRRVTELFMFDFEQSGIHLDEQKRSRFVQLNEAILMLGNQFMQGAQAPVSVPRDQIPEHVKRVFSGEGDTITVSGYFSDHHSDLVREAAYRLYLHPETRQLDLLHGLLESRNNLANLVGFPTYAHRALRATMGSSPDKVMVFLETLAEKIRPRAEIDFEEIRKMKLAIFSADEYRDISVKPWDPPYYSGLARSEGLQCNGRDLMPYFSLGACMDGLNNLLECLFDVSLVAEPAQLGELWAPDVHKLCVQHKTEGTLGYIYCDFFERLGKAQSDCHFTIRGGRQLDDGTYQLPVVVLLLSLSAPRGQTPSLLTPSMVENLFHEFGHALHSMLGRTRYQHVTGTRCPTDYAEVPSVLMEYFATDPRVLSTFARHWETGEKLPEDTLNRLCRVKHMFGAAEMQLQVFYSILDQLYHGKHPLIGSSTDVLQSTQNQYYSLPYVPGTAWQQRFSHFVGYGAKYYAYLMSRAVASTIWHRCFKQDPFSRTMGERYRQEMLAHGGGKEPDDLIHAMLGESLTPEQMVLALLKDLDHPSRL